MDLFLIWVVSIFLAAAIGGRKDAAGTGLVLGIFLGPLGVLLALVIQGDRKACPYCKELINKAAVKCPRCQSSLGEGWGSSPATAPAGMTSDKSPGAVPEPFRKESSSGVRVLEEDELKRAAWRNLIFPFALIVIVIGIAFWQQR